jgi:uncharacterized protein (DUF427 family)
MKERMRTRMSISYVICKTQETANATRNATRIAISKKKKDEEDQKNLKIHYVPLTQIHQRRFHRSTDTRIISKHGHDKML